MQGKVLVWKSTLLTPHCLKVSTIETISNENRPTWSTTTITTHLGQAPSFPGSILLVSGRSPSCPWVNDGQIFIFSKSSKRLYIRSQRSQNSHKSHINPFQELEVQESLILSHCFIELILEEILHLVILAIQSNTFVTLAKTPAARARFQINFTVYIHAFSPRSADFHPSPPFPPLPAPPRATLILINSADSRSDQDSTAIPETLLFSLFHINIHVFDQ